MRTLLTNKKHVTILTFIGVVSVVASAILIPTLTSASGPTIRQGTTTTYGVLAATTVTNTGVTTISGSAGGDVGLSPGTSYTGSSTVTRSGVDHIADAAAAIAQSDLTIAFGDLGAPTPTTLAAEDLAGQTITPGTYATAAGTFSNSGTVTLDAGGDATAIFIFQAASTVITSTGSTMVLAGGAQACNVFWRVGSSATIGSGSTFIGHIYAQTSITAVSGATIFGNLLARDAAVTLDNTTIINNNCIAPAPTATATPTQAEIPSPPQDSTITSITTSECTTTEDYTVYILGTFPSAVTNVSLNGRNLPITQWVQRPTQIEVTIPASARKTHTIDIFNGRIPLLPTQVFICDNPVIEVVATASPKPEVSITPIPEAIIIPGETTTEIGGELPDTGTNTYTYLLIGLALLASGAGGFILKQRIKKS